MRRKAVLGLAIVLMLALVPGSAGAATSAYQASAATQVAAVVLPPTSGHGSNFLIKSQADDGYCIEVGAGLDEGRLLTLQQCGTADTQRWTLTWGADDLNEMVEAQGMCVTVKGHKLNDGLPLAVVRCHQNRAEALTFTASGQLAFANGGCLSIPGAASGVAVSRTPCDESKKTQLWKLAH